MGLDKVVNSAIVGNLGVFIWGLADPAHASWADTIEHALLAIFVGEMVLKLRAANWSVKAFLRNRWHVFDVCVILLALMPMLPGAAVLRLARLARLAKLLHLARHAAALRAVELPVAASNRVTTN
jgi:voltage-gated sodium channel